MKVTPGNPQWLEWVEGWAAEANDKSAQAYAKAARSLKACPITYTHPNEATALEGIGPGITGRLTKVLQKYCDDHGEEMPDEPIGGRKGGAAKPKAPAKKRKQAGPTSDEERDMDDAREARRNRTQGTAPIERAPANLPRPPVDDSDDDAPPVAKKKRATTKKYVPKHSSGGYAILLALYILGSYDDPEMAQLKADIQRAGGPYSESPFETATSSRGGHAEAGPSSFYGPWNSMKTLVGKALVVEINGRPKRFSLTAEGYSLAEALASKADGIVLHVRGPSSESVGETWVQRSVNRRESNRREADDSLRSLLVRARSPGDPATPRDGPQYSSGDDEDARFEKEMAYVTAQSVKEVREARRNAVASTSAARAPLAIPRPRAMGASSSSMANAPLNGRLAATGAYARNGPDPVVTPATFGHDSPFGFHYLDEADTRVTQRKHAEEGQEDGTFAPIYRIEYRTAQDLHSMARSILRKAPINRAVRLSGGSTMTGYLRARVSTEECPGFFEVVAKVAPAAVAAAMVDGLMRSYKAPPKVDKNAMYAAPADVQRSGMDAIAIARLSSSDAVSSTSGPLPRRLPRPGGSAVVAAPPAAARGTPVAARPPSVAERTQSAPVRVLPRALPPLRNTASLPLPTAFDSDSPLINRHPLDPVRDHVSSTTYDFSRVRPIKILAGSFKVVLLVDTRELGNDKNNRTEIVDNLKSLGVVVEQKMLPLGDMIWVARRCTVGGKVTGEDDIVLDTIVERKRLDDLCKSIKDGRYMAQKVRMKDSAISDRIYLIEKYDTDQQYAEYGKAIWTCKSQLQINDGFYVHESSNIADTIKYLRQRTLVMIELYENKDLHLIPDVHIDRPSYLPLQKHLRATSPSTTFLTTYTSFCNLNRTDAALSLRTQWATMIQMNSGVSAEKAVQFIRRWPTPRSFWDGTRDHRRIVEKELEEAGPGGEGKGKKKARKAEDYISECFEGDTLSRGLKGKLATKLFHLFASVDYED